MMATSICTLRQGRRCASAYGLGTGKPLVQGMREDLAELSNQFKTGFSRFSSLSSVMRVVRGDDLLGPISPSAPASEAPSASAEGPSAPEGVGKALEASPAQGVHRSESKAEEAPFSVEGAAQGERPGAGAPKKDKEASREEEEDEEEEEEEDEEEEEGLTKVGAAAAEALLRAAKEDIQVLSGTLASGISEFSSFARGLLAAAGSEWQEEEGEGEEGDEPKEVGSDAEASAVGLTDDVISFAHNISQHPETWIEFPLPDEDDEPEDFRPTPQQEAHIEAVELRVPRLVAVRLELTPSYISENRFWKIYFVLLHSHLPPAASAVLSTPAILAARARVVRQLQEAEGQQEEDAGLEGSKAEGASPSGTDAEAHAATGTGESVLAEDPVAPLSSRGDAPEQPAAEETKPASSAPTSRAPESSQTSAAAAAPAVTRGGPAPAEEEEEEADDWLNEDIEDTGASGGVPGTALGDGEGDEVSFSDLEDDDDEEVAAEGGAVTGAQAQPVSGTGPMAPQGVPKAPPSHAAASGGAAAGPNAPSGAASSASTAQAGGPAKGGGVPGEWVELKAAGQDGNSSGGSDNHSADWQTVEAEDLP